MGQGGLPANNIVGPGSRYLAPRQPGPNLVCAPPLAGAPPTGGAVYGSQYGENLGAGPGSTIDQSSAVLGTGCPPR